MLLLVTAPDFMGSIVRAHIESAMAHCVAIIRFICLQKTQIAVQTLDPRSITNKKRLLLMAASDFTGSILKTHMVSAMVLFFLLWPHQLFPKQSGKKPDSLLLLAFYTLRLFQ